MRRKSADKPFWEMTTDELRDATKEFDEEFVAEKAKPFTPQMQARWNQARRNLARAENGLAQETIAVRMEKALLDRCTALAKTKRICRDALIARGIKALLAAEGEKI
jgi:ribosomal protein L29